MILMKNNIYIYMQEVLEVRHRQAEGAQSLRRRRLRSSLRRLRVQPRSSPSGPPPLSLSLTLSHFIF